MVIAPIEAVLHLKMSPDIEIAGYEEPLPSPERVDLMKEVKTHDIVTKNKPAVAILYPTKWCQNASNFM